MERLRALNTQRPEDRGWLETEVNMTGTVIVPSRPLFCSTGSRRAVCTDLL